MSTRANWFTDGVATIGDEPDPFAVPIEEIGEEIDLRSPTARLELRLRELLYREGNLFANGLTCAIKDRGDSTCHACPVSYAHGVEALGALCRIGREQESVSTELAVLQCQGR